MDCFLVPLRDLRCFYAVAVAPKSALFWGTHPTPLKTEISTLSTKSQTFYKINFFSWYPRGIFIFGGLWGAFLAHLSTFNAFFGLRECPKMGFFLQGSHISRFLCTFAQKEFISDGPKGFECILDFCACSWERQLAFLASGNASKWGFFPKDRTYRAFFVLLHKRNFFQMVPKGLNAFWTFVHAAESAN